MTARRVLVSVGTDHHPFPRLLGWVLAAAQRHPASTFTVQAGATPPPSGLQASAYLPREAMDAAFAAADVVICHGGPATISEARRHGRLPIVVPRDPALGEHIDDHQQRYAAALGHGGLVCLALDEAAFHRVLDEAIADPSAYAAEAGAGDEVERTVERLGALIDDLVANPAGYRPAGRVARVLARMRRIG